MMKTLPKYISEKLIINKKYVSSEGDEILEIYNKYANPHYVYPYSKKYSDTNRVNSFADKIMNLIYFNFDIDAENDILTACKEFEKFDYLCKYDAEYILNNGISNAIVEINDIKEQTEVYRDKNTLITITSTEKIVMLTAFKEKENDLRFYGFVFFGLNKKDIKYNKK